jgi:AcrR family transcriptional regulator
MTIDFETDTTPELGPLPRGRHNLSAETVRESQRQRLLRAMLESVGERGYDATSVPQVVALAKVSRNAFYELFKDKLDCFLVLCEALSEQLLDEVFRPRGFSNWREAVRDGAQRYLSHWQSRPLFARAYLIELPTAGPRALLQRAAAYELFSHQFELVAAWARQQEPDLAPLRPLAPRFLVWSITELVTAEVAAERDDSLMALDDEVVWLIERLLAERSSPG